MTLDSGARLGPFEILAPLGAGGMGEVYRARDTRLGRDVAIKVLPDSVAADPDTLSRFEREAKAVAALSHPNILSIFDFGTHEGISYAIMELLEGETLRGKLDAGAIPQKQAVDYAVQIAKGLSAAHERGIVHRDLKPENLFVTKDGHLKILDFGLAKRVAAVAPGEETSAPTVSGHTMPGTVMGTLGYMSPEQVKGLAVDHRSDIFSFGAVLYEMLSGQRAFSRATASETIAAILKEEPPELSQSGRNVSLALDHVIRHCLEKDRDNRFQSARDIAFALSEASGPTVASGAQLPGARTRRKRVLTAAAILALLGVTGIFLLRRPPRSGGGATGVKRVAVLPFENLGAPDDDYFADGMADAIRGKLTSLPGVQVIARTSSTSYKKTTKTVKQIAQELEVEYILTATVRWQKAGGTSRVEVSPELVEISSSGAPTSRWQQPFDAALTDVFQVQADIATEVSQALGVALGTGGEKRLSERPTQNLAAYDAFLRGQEVGADPGAGWTPAYRRAVAFYEQAVALDPMFAQAWAGLSSARSWVYNQSPAPQLAEQARTAADRALALAPNAPEPYLAEGLYEMLVRGDSEGALEQLGKGHRLAPGRSDLLVAMGVAEAILGRREEAVEHYTRAERLDPRSLDPKLFLGAVLMGLRRYAEARDLFDRALVLAPANLTLIQWKADTRLVVGDLAGARRVLANVPREVEPTALVAYMANYGDQGWVLDKSHRELLLRVAPSAFDDDRAVWGLCLSQAYALKSDAANVRVYAEEAQRGFEERVRGAPNDSTSHSLLGVSLAYLGRKDEAIHEGKRALELPGSREYCQHQLVRIYILVGEPEKALDQLEPLLKTPYILSPGWLKIDPNFDPLRSNPRFQKLIASPR